MKTFNAEYRAIQVGIGFIIALQLGGEGVDVFGWLFIYMLIMDCYRWIVDKLEKPHENT
jgi:hypothetical protein